MEYESITVGQLISKIKEFEKLHGIDLTNVEISYEGWEHGPENIKRIQIELYENHVGEPYILLEGF